MRGSGSKASSDSQDANQVCVVGYLGEEGSRTFSRASHPSASLIWWIVSQYSPQSLAGQHTFDCIIGTLACVFWEVNTGLLE